MPTQVGARSSQVSSCIQEPEEVSLVATTGSSILGFH